MKGTIVQVNYPVGPGRKWPLACVNTINAITW